MRKKIHISGKIEDHALSVLLDKVSVPDKARLLSISSPHAAAWLSVIPSLRLNLHLEPAEFQIAVKLWLGIAVTDIPVRTFCPSHALDSLGHHAFTCKHRGDVASRHNRLRDVLLESCRRACLGLKLKQEVVWGMKDIEHGQQTSLSLFGI